MERKIWHKWTRPRCWGKFEPTISRRSSYAVFIATDAVGWFALAVTWGWIDFDLTNLGGWRWLIVIPLALALPLLIFPWLVCMGDALEWIRRDMWDYAERKWPGKESAVMKTMTVLILLLCMPLVLILFGGIVADR